MAKLGLKTIRAALAVAFLVIMAFTFKTFAAPEPGISPGLCSDPFHNNEVCQRMRHLRSIINAMDAQRDLVQVNYPYMQAMATNMKANSLAVIGQLSESDPNHAAGLKSLVRMATELELRSGQHEPASYSIANNIRAQCMTCHSSTAPTSGVKWNEAFKQDWEMITKECNKPGKNPFLCKNMNGMVSAYGQMVTAYVAGISNYEITEYSSLEVVRILRLLKDKNYMHMREGLRQEAEERAIEVVELSRRNDPEVFEKAFDLPKACVQCHNSNGTNPWDDSNAKISWHSPFFPKSQVSQKK